MGKPGGKIPVLLIGVPRHTARGGRALNIQSRILEPADALEGFSVARA